MTIFLTVIQVICGLLLIGIIMMQSGKSAGLSGSIAGVADYEQTRGKNGGRQDGQSHQMDWRCVHHPDAAAEPDCLNNKSVKKAAPAGSGLFFALAGAARGSFFEIFSTGAVFLRAFWYNTSHIEKTHARMVH